MELVHGTVVLHVDRDLLFVLAMQHSERGPDVDLGVVWRAGAQKRADYPRLLVIAAEVVVEDREERDGVDGDTARCPAAQQVK
jgi:hypothetical protein